MLNVYIVGEEKPNIEYIHDVDAYFIKVELTGSAVEKQILNQIEQAQYCDNLSFIDRFGYKLTKDRLSTGCKAALTVLYSTDKLVSLKECGYNAITTILNLCKYGNIYIPDYQVAIPYTKNTNSVDIKIDNYNIKTMRKFNEYMCNERPFEPNIVDRSEIICLN